MHQPIIIDIADVEKCMENSENSHVQRLHFSDFTVYSQNFTICFLF